MTPPLAEDESKRFQGLAESLVHTGRNWVWDMKSDRIYWSAELVRVYGVAPDTFDGTGSSIARLVHPDDAPKRERALAEALRGEKVEPFEYRVVREDGEQRVVLMKDLQLHGELAGDSAYLSGVVQDITELKLLEEQLSLLSEELETRVCERTAELERANTRLKELDRLKSIFIALTSHELRTPLNSILGFISMTLYGLSGALNDEQRDNLSRAHASALHLLSLITDVIDISKIEGGKTEAYPESLTLGEVVAEAAAAIEPQRKEKGLSLEIAVPAGTRLHTDRRRLLQCLINLLGNAVKFTEKGGISVSARESGDAVELSVRDTGIGMAANDLPRLFQPFVRLQSHLAVRTGGTGLGLYLTRKLCTDILRGDISVQSRQGEGSTFTMTVARELLPSPVRPGQ